MQVAQDTFCWRVEHSTATFIDLRNGMNGFAAPGERVPESSRESERVRASASQLAGKRLRASVSEF